MIKQFTLTGSENTNLKTKSPQYLIKYIVLPVVIIILILLAVWFFFFRGTQVFGFSLENQQQIKAEESKKYMDLLKSVMLIDDTETPVIAKVSDSEKLKKNNPEFYKNLMNGDIVYIYSYRIIVVRESQRKIVNIAPIINTKNLTGNSTSSTSTSAMSVTSTAASSQK